MNSTPAPLSTAAAARVIWSGTGEVKISPGQAAVSIPIPTKPPCSGSCPDPPPETSPTFPSYGRAPPDDHPPFDVDRQLGVHRGEPAQRVGDHGLGNVDQHLHGVPPGGAGVRWVPGRPVAALTPGHVPGASARSRPSGTRCPVSDGRTPGVTDTAGPKCAAFRSAHSPAPPRTIPARPRPGRASRGPRRTPLRFVGPILVLPGRPRDSAVTAPAPLALTCAGGTAAGRRPRRYGPAARSPAGCRAGSGGSGSGGAAARPPG